MSGSYKHIGKWYDAGLNWTIIRKKKHTLEDAFTVAMAVRKAAIKVSLF